MVLHDEEIPETGNKCTVAVNVSYVLTHVTENAITMDRITVITVPSEDSTSASGLRKQKVTEEG
jgi:hypothetical protein